MANVNTVPKDMSGFVPYIIVRNADEAVRFYEKAFQGSAGMVLKMKDGTVGHAEVKIGNATIMLAEEKAEWGTKGPLTIGGCPLTLTLYVEDVDKAFRIAVSAGMKIKKEVETHFYGDRMGSLTDPYGYEWCLGSRVEEVTPGEMQKRMNEMYG